MMINIRTITLSLVILFSCNNRESNSEKEEFAELKTEEEIKKQLTGRAEKYLQLVTKFPNTQSEYVKQLFNFYDPKIKNRLSLCIDLYRHWRSNFDEGHYSFYSEVDSVYLVPNYPDSGIVIIKDFWTSPTSDTTVFMAKLPWIKRNHKWYRIKGSTVSEIE